MNFIRICPECGGEQEVHFSPAVDFETYCLNHEDEPSRENRPAHVRREVVLAPTGSTC